MASAAIRPDTDSHHHKIGREYRSVGKQDTLDLLFTNNLLGAGLGHDLDAALFNCLFEQIARRRIELALHQCRHDMQDGHVHVAGFETRRRFEPEQSATDDDGPCPRLRGEQHGPDVVKVAIGQNTGKIIAGHRQDKRQRTRWRSEACRRVRLFPHRK